jgi:hypothetical protein
MLYLFRIASRACLCIRQPRPHDCMIAHVQHARYLLPPNMASCGCRDRGPWWVSSDVREHDMRGGSMQDHFHPAMRDPALATIQISPIVERKGGGEWREGKVQVSAIGSPSFPTRSDRKSRMGSKRFASRRGSFHPPCSSSAVPCSILWGPWQAS